MSNGIRSAETLAELDQEIAETEVSYDDAYVRMIDAQREAERTRDLFGRLTTWREAMQVIRDQYLATHRELQP